METKKTELQKVFDQINIDLDKIHREIKETKIGIEEATMEIVSIRHKLEQIKFLIQTGNGK